MAENVTLTFSCDHNNALLLLLFHAAVIEGRAADDTVLFDWETLAWLCDEFICTVEWLKPQLQAMHEGSAPWQVSAIAELADRYGANLRHDETNEVGA